jgi:hypothetical protein
MRAGEFADGTLCLRAKIDMASPNIHFRDPVIYRIMRVAHYHTGDRWCIYPMYDFAHPIEDALEGITHSLCTLEFEVHRLLYDWVIDRMDEMGLLVERGGHKVRPIQRELSARTAPHASSQRASPPTRPPSPPAAGKGKGVIADPIGLRIYIPRVVDLLIVDTPGITKVPVGDQPPDIEMQIRRLCLHYLTQPNYYRVPDLRSPNSTHTCPLINIYQLDVLVEGLGGMAPAAAAVAAFRARAAAAGLPCIHNDFPHEPDRCGMPEGHSPLERHLGVPVSDGGRVRLDERRVAHAHVREHEDDVVAHGGGGDNGHCWTYGP